MSEWQPIETAPKDGTKILAYDPDGIHDPVYAVICWYVHETDFFEEMEGGLYKKSANKTAWWDGASYLPFNATHWMPLPEPPTE